MNKNSPRTHFPDAQPMTRKAGSREHAQKTSDSAEPRGNVRLQIAGRCVPPSAPLAAPSTRRLKGALVGASRFTIFCIISPLAGPIDTRALHPPRSTRISCLWERRNGPHWWHNAEEARRRSYTEKRLHALGPAHALQSEPADPRPPLPKAAFSCNLGHHHVNFEQGLPGVGRFSLRLRLKPVTEYPGHTSTRWD